MRYSNSLNQPWLPPPPPKNIAALMWPPSLQIMTLIAVPMVWRCVCVCNVNKVDTVFSKHAQSFHFPSHRRLISPGNFLHLNFWTSTSSSMLQIATLSCHTTLKPRSTPRFKIYQMTAPNLKWWWKLMSGVCITAPVSQRVFNLVTSVVSRSITTTTSRSRCTSSCLVLLAFSTIIRLWRSSHLTARQFFSMNMNWALRSMTW